MESASGKGLSKGKSDHPLFCHRFNFTQDDSYIRVISRKRRLLEIQPTQLRQSHLYYKIYCIGLNTIFASIIPLLSLIYLNICTVNALRKMGREVVDWTFEGQRTPVRRFPFQSPPTRQCNSEGNTTREHPSLPRTGTLRRIFEPSSFQKSRSLEVVNNQRPTVRRNQSEDLESTFGSSTSSSGDNGTMALNNSVSPHFQELETKQSQKKTIPRPKKPLRKVFTRTASFLTKNGATVTRSIHHQRSFLAAIEAKAEDLANRRASSLMRRQENRLTRISLSIVSLFVICHVWRLIPTAYEAFFSRDGTVLSQWPTWLLHIHHLSHTLIVFNSAVNFLLYVVW